MIVGERILEVSGSRLADANIKGLGINISLDSVEVAQDGNLEMTYVYIANYQEKVGELKIKGVLIAQEEEKLKKSIVDSWKKDKKLPEGYAETMLSAINYSGSANGTLVARVLGLTAPLIPPRIQLSKPAAPAAKK